MNKKKLTRTGAIVLGALLLGMLAACAPNKQAQIKSAVVAWAKAHPQKNTMYAIFPVHNEPVVGLPKTFYNDRVVFAAKPGSADAKLLDVFVTNGWLVAENATIWRTSLGMLGVKSKKNPGPSNAPTRALRIYGMTKTGHAVLHVQPYTGKHSVPYIKWVPFKVVSWSKTTNSNGQITTKINFKIEYANDKKVTAALQKMVKIKPGKYNVGKTVTAKCMLTPLHKGYSVDSCNSLLSHN